MRGVSTLNDAVLEAASEAPTMRAFRGSALALAREALDADVGVFATKAPGGVDRSLFGFDEPMLAQLSSRWEVYGREIAQVDAEARRLGAATDRRTLGGALERTHVYRELMAPVRGEESLLVGLELRGRRLGLFMIGRLAGKRFSEAEVGVARSLAKALAVSCAALDALDPLSRPLPVALSAIEQELLRYLELGYTSRDIAVARGTSFYTVRNQLSALYRKLGVANRTEAVGLRIVRPGG